MCAVLRWNTLQPVSAFDIYWRELQISETTYHKINTEPWVTFDSRVCTEGIWTFIHEHNKLNDFLGIFYQSTRHIHCLQQLLVICLSIMSRTKWLLAWWLPGCSRSGGRVRRERSTSPAALHQARHHATLIKNVTRLAPVTPPLIHHTSS